MRSRDRARHEIACGNAPSRRNLRGNCACSTFSFLLRVVSVTNHVSGFTLTRVGILCLVTGFVLAGACGSNEPPSPCTIGKPCQFSGGTGYTYDGLSCVGEQAYDNGQPFCSCTCAAGLRDAGADGSDAADSSQVARDAGVCGSGPPDACNRLANVGSVIKPTCVAGAPPAMSGGPIADGTYVLVSGMAYSSSCSGVSLPAGGPTTILVAAGCMQSVDANGGAKTNMWTASGSTLSTAEVCPGSSLFELSYTATPTTLSELDPVSPGISVISVFRKQ
jgi:hypothetical protein